MTTPRRALEPEDSDPAPRRGRSWIAGLLALVLLVGGAAAGVYFGGSALRTAVGEMFAVADYPGPGGDTIVVTIPKGANLTRIGELLTNEGVVKSADAFVRAAGEEPLASTIQAGSFRLRKEIPGSTAVELLLDPANAERNGYTLREGSWLGDQVKAMSQASGLPAAGFEAVLKNPKAAGLPGWAGTNAEGLLFPDTYAVPDPVDAAAMVNQATSRFAAVADELNLAAGAKQLGRTPLEVVTVASIVEREVFREEDRAKVARVIYNRLADGTPLQLDSTVAYASGKRGTVWTTDKERASDSPYNTYKYKGLPPGPIGAPSRASLVAALQPAKGEWRFFVPVNLDTGETRFSRTYAEHTKAVAELHAWCAASDQNKAKCA